MGWALIRGWALINFFCLWHGRLFEVGANSRLGAYSNKYGIFTSPVVISTSPKSFLRSRTDFTVLLLFAFLKKHHLPVRQVKNRIPLATGYGTLLSLHAGEVLINSGFSLNSKVDM